MWKTKFLGTSSEGLFRTPDRISHCIHIFKTSCSQLPARSGIFCLLFEVVYWPCGLKFVYLMINLAFRGIIFKVKLPTKFCLHSFEWFFLQIICEAKYFLSCPRHCDWGLIVVIVYYFQILNKKKYNFIISRVISSHMDPMYIETPYINGLHLFWDSFEWFYHQLSCDAKYFSLLVGGRTAAGLWSAVSRTRWILFAAFLSNCVQFFFSIR